MATTDEETAVSGGLKLRELLHGEQIVSQGRLYVHVDCSRVVIASEKSQDRNNMSVTVPEAEAQCSWGH